MPTVDNKKMIDEIIANNGEYMDDPPVLVIVQYKNYWGGLSYKLCYNEAHFNSIMSNPQCHDQKIIFERLV